MENNKGNNEKVLNDDTFNMQINEETKRKFKIKCVENGTTMSKVLKKYIDEYISE